MNILIIGKGAREHALAWHFSQSPLVTEIWVAPGNAGTEQTAKTQNLQVTENNISRLVNFAQHNTIDFCFVCTENALTAGLADAMQAANITCFGPLAAAAKLETSVSFVKSFMTQHQIPSPNYASFHDHAAALNYISSQSYPIIIKPDDPEHIPAIYIAHNKAEAENIINSLSQQIIIEEYIHGEEFNLTVLSDGQNVLPITSTVNFRHLQNNNEGPLTSGMGACSPAPNINEDIVSRVMTEVVNPTLTALGAEGNHYFGFLHIALKLTAEQELKVLDFNCRLGDPDIQVILPRLNTNLIDLCLAAKNKSLNQSQKVTNNLYAVAVISACQGYPTPNQTKEKISINAITCNKSCQLFHASTALINNELVTQSGRVLCACAWSNSYPEASKQAYSCLQSASWPNMIYRTDIKPNSEETLAS